MEKKIVVIGAGYAGVLTAKKLAKKFKKDDSVKITIIDKNPFHTMLTELHEVAANRVEEDSIKMSLKKIFAKRKVDIVLDKVTSIDFDSKLIIGNNGTYQYDYLILATGSKPTFYGVEGAKENAHTLWSYEDAINLRDQIHNSFSRAVCEANLEEKKRLLTFYVVGASYTGIEMVGELAEYVQVLCRKNEVERELVTIINVDVLERTVPNFPKKLSDKVERRLKKMGVGVLLNTSVCGIGPDYIDVKQKDICTRHPAGTVIWAAGIESSDIATEASKTLGSVARGRIKVDSFLRSTEKGKENIYVVGDNMFYVPEGEEMPVPQIVENCEQSSAIAANNLYCAIVGKGEMKAYKPAMHGIMVSIGGRYGVARVGLPNLMFNLVSPLAMLSKHFINIIYFIQILGWNKIYSYIRHEFFTIRDCRSFVGGHFSNRTPSFLLVPLRLWLGAVWLFEGIMKIVEGWFGAPKLTGFFGGANSWFNNILSSASAVVTQAQTSSVAEAVSSATGAAQGTVASVGAVLVNFKFLNLIHVILISGKKLSESTLNDFAFKLDIPIMNWFVDTLILPNNTVQIIMQIFIVVAEILIGLALIGGLFTTPSAAVSLVLQFMFVCTTGLYLGTFWMIFAGIAVLIAAGRTFGLDYYFMPFLKGLWKKLPFVKRLYIYND